MGAERFFNIKCRASGLVARRRRAGGHRARAEGALRQVPGRRRQAAAARAAGREPRRRARRRGQPAQADRERAACTASRPSWRSTPFPTDHASEHDAIRDDRRVDGRPGRRVQPLHRRRRGAQPSWPRRSSRRASEPSGVPLPVPVEAHRCGRRSRRSPRRSTAPAGVDVFARRRRASSTRYERNGFGAPARLHGQDPPVDLGRPVAEGRADRSPTACPRGAS